MPASERLATCHKWLSSTTLDKWSVYLVFAWNVSHQVWWRQPSFLWLCSCWATCSHPLIPELYRINLLRLAPWVQKSWIDMTDVFSLNFQRVPHMHTWIKFDQVWQQTHRSFSLIKYDPCFAPSAPRLSPTMGKRASSGAASEQPAKAARKGPWVHRILEAVQNFDLIIDWASRDCELEKLEHVSLAHFQISAYAPAFMLV